MPKPLFPADLKVISWCLTDSVEPLPTILAVDRKYGDTENHKPAKSCV